MSPASRLLPRALPQLRAFSTSRHLLNDSSALPAKKPMGAFRGGLFGFLFGTTLSGTLAYTYLAKEYRATNDLLSEDIYRLQASVNMLSNHVKNLEQQQQQQKRK